jgi:hypothetical protein
MRAVYQKTVASAGTAEAITTSKLRVKNGLKFIAEKANGAANTGSIYIGLSGMNTTTKAGVIEVIATGGSVTYACPGAMPSDIFIDAANTNDGVRVVSF